MAYEYCCFISYPHGQNNVLVPLVQKIVEALEKEIGAQTDKRVWLDSNFLQGGQILDNEIGAKLCKSACMILFYTPLYFDTEHIYCARELKAMQDLEEQRLKLLKEKGDGLIIPIIFRGEKKYPLGTRWKYYKFTDIEMNDPVEQIPFRYAKEIRSIAEYIIERFNDLKAVAHLNEHDCNQYSLPTAEDARKFVENVLNKKITDVEVSFVGRV
jgi:hypothetical protein